jgi:hypothetical protein
VFYITQSISYNICRVGQDCIYNIYTVFDRIFGEFPAKIPYVHRIYIYIYIYIYIWFWPTLHITKLSIA